MSSPVCGGASYAVNCGQLGGRRVGLDPLLDALRGLFQQLLNLEGIFNFLIRALSGFRKCG